MTVIRQYITNRFREYETMANALGTPIKPKYEPKLPRLPPVDITAGAATTEEGEGAGGQGDNDNDKEAYQDKDDNDKKPKRNEE